MDLQQRSDAWFAARRGKLTASNLGALMGLVSWTSRVEAYRRMMGWSKFEGNAACTYGIEMENTALNAYSLATGNKVDQSGLHLHPQYRFIAGSPDGLVGTEGMIEIKCPFYTKVPHCKVPNYYYLQINCLLECTQRNWCDFVSWTMPAMTIFRVYKDPDLFEWLCTHSYKDIWDAVQQNKPSIPSFKNGEKEIILERIQQSMATKIDYKFWSCSSILPSEQPIDPYAEVEIKRKFDDFNLTREQDDSSDEPGLSAVSVAKAPRVEA